jgi:hypothetical protein
VQVRSIRSGYKGETRAGRGLQIQVERSAVIAVLAVCSWACAPAPTFPYAHGVDGNGNPAPQHFLVLPLNVAVRVPAGLEGTTDDVFSAVATYLRDRGNSIETISPETALEQWRSTIAEVAASATLKHDFYTAMRVFIERARESKKFDALIMPALVLRDAESRERMIKWDGVIRKYEIVNLSEEAKKQKISSQLAPVFTGVSLHVIVFGTSGDVIFEGYGGLDLAHDLDMTGAEVTMRAKLSMRSELLTNTRNLREGTAYAFDPYLPRE